MIILRKAKPEWFSPSDIRQVIFVDVKNRMKIYIKWKLGCSILQH